MIPLEVILDWHYVSVLVRNALCMVIYRIMQIVRGGKGSRLHDLLVIRGKTFAIIQQFETPYNKKEKNCWKTFVIGG